MANKKIIEIAEPKLRNILSNQIQNALGFLGGQLSETRRKSLEYYLGDRLGTEIDGRSQVVSTDVADTIESMLPGLLRVFTASDKVVSCEPVTGEDVALAEQATAYLNHVFYKDNPGFKLLYNFFKDSWASSAALGTTCKINPKIDAQNDRFGLQKWSKMAPKSDQKTSKNQYEKRSNKKNQNKMNIALKHKESTNMNKLESKQACEE